MKTSDRYAALVNRGKELHESGRHADALTAFDAAIAMDADRAEAWNNRARILQIMGRFDEALASFDRTLTIRPDHATALHYRGSLFLALRKPNDAVASFKAALAVKPDYAEAEKGLAFAKLTLGKFTEGWQHYEARWRIKRRRLSNVPLWLGAEPIAGKTILLHEEQGLGDTIQFARYASLLERAGARVLLGVQPTLKALLAPMLPSGRVIAGRDPLPALDYQCPLLSLPLACGTTVETIPADVPYVTARPADVERWRPRIPSAPCRVGLVWSGNAAHPNDQNRSIAFDKLAPLLNVPALQFVGLQKDLRDVDTAARSTRRLAHLGDDLADFADTAAVVAQLDLVITVDTAVAHLAGAMGKPVWIMLPFAPDFRWMLDREDSPWYPTARLFRQSARGDWDGVIERVKVAVTLASRFNPAKRSRR